MKKSSGAVIVASAAAVGFVGQVAADQPPDDHVHPVTGVSAYSSSPYNSSANLASAHGADSVATYTNWTSSEIFSVGNTYPAPDVSTFITDASGTPGGWAQCAATLGNGRCDRWNVWYRSAYWTATQRASSNFWRGLGCHEIVHTVGVLERSYSDCLNANYMAGNYNVTSGRNPTYQANIDEINAVYKNVA